MTSLSTFGIGLIVGLIFAWMKAPVPAPPTLTGVLGIAGLSLGYMLMAPRV